MIQAFSNSNDRLSCVLFGTLAFLAIVIGSEPASAFIIDPSITPWTTTASGSRTGNGVAGTLTWSIVPDGTSVTDGTNALGGSDLNAFLSSTFSGAATGQSLIGQALGRWDEISGLSFVYEPNDDGGNHDDKAGVLGVRGDVRIAGASVDGSGGTLAFNFFPQFGGDMVIDTDDDSLFGNSANNYRYFRNTLMHEIGHAFSLDHVSSNSDALLLESFIDTAFDGPQLDEVRAIQYYFGDAYEEAFNGLGNGTVARATDLGNLTLNSPISIGEDANVPTQAISATATDFVSVSNLADTDYYSFTLTEHALLSADLTPLGGTFDQGGENEFPTSFDADARSALSLSIFDTNGTSLLGEANQNGAGQAESLDSIALAPGTYYSRIEGAADTIQLYMLELSLTSLTGDYNADGTVDAADYTLWRDTLNQSVTPGTGADGNLDGIITAADYTLWVTNYGNQLATVNQSLSSVAVPEPATLTMVALSLLASISKRQRS